MTVESKRSSGFAAAGVTRRVASLAEARARSHLTPVRKPSCRLWVDVSSAMPVRSLYQLYWTTLTVCPVGAIIGAAAVQASLYDVPGGYKAVMFDRFSGVQNKVRFDLLLQCHKY